MYQKRPRFLTFPIFAPLCSQSCSKSCGSARAYCHFLPPFCSGPRSALACTWCMWLSCSVERGIFLILIIYQISHFSHFRSRLLPVVLLILFLWRANRYFMLSFCPRSGPRSTLAFTWCMQLSCSVARRHLCISKTTTISHFSHFRPLLLPVALSMLAKALQ